MCFLWKITEIFKEFQPSIFLPMVAGGSIELFIYYYLCKKFNVFYAIHFDLRTKNLFSYTSNLNYTFPLIEKDTNTGIVYKNNVIYFRRIIISIIFCATSEVFR